MFAYFFSCFLEYLHIILSIWLKDVTIASKNTVDFMSDFMSEYC